jgi:hypothetical protein
MTVSIACRALTRCGRQKILFAGDDDVSFTFTIYNYGLTICLRVILFLRFPLFHCPIRVSSVFNPWLKTNPPSWLQQASRSKFLSFFCNKFWNLLSGKEYE